MSQFCKNQCGLHTMVHSYAPVNQAFKFIWDIQELEKFDTPFSDTAPGTKGNQKSLHHSSRGLVQHNHKIRKSPQIETDNLHLQSL